MNKPSCFGSETLNAYLDGELDAAEAEQLRQAAACDEALARHLEELRRVRALTRAALCRPPPLEAAAGTPPWVATAASPSRPIPPHRHWAAALAAGMALLALAAGLGIGRYLIPSAAPPATAELGALQAYLPPGAQAIQPASFGIKPAAPATELRLLFHISEDNARALAAAFDRIEKLLADYTAARQPVMVEVLANAEGLRLLRAETATDAQRERIRQLQAAYPNLRFLACGNTLRRLRLEGQKVELLPEVVVVKSALDQVVQRLQEGWTYVKI
jgi:intracellular sulfur oxidation DsrE/DsrF family protein